MRNNKRILAVVTARSGSKGVPDKNMRVLKGVSLIGRAGDCLAQLEWLDKAIISTDSKEYAEEGMQHDLEAPFLRPEYLSHDTAGSIDTVIHALEFSEGYYREHYDIVLIIEPTSPLRNPEDIEKAVDLLIESQADSVVTVSTLDLKFHPAKILAVEEGLLKHYEERGKQVVYRQALEGYYWRNGVCYALTRECLAGKKLIFSEKTIPLIIERPIVNIDDAEELKLAELYL